MKTYQINGKIYTEEEVIEIHRMWQDIQDRENVSDCIEISQSLLAAISLIS